MNKDETGKATTTNTVFYSFRYESNRTIDPHAFHIYQSRVTKLSQICLG